jgi:hypothetical protein
MIAAALAAAALCHGQLAPKPPDPEAAVKDFAAQRAEFGFRHDLPYVRYLIKQGVWEYDVGYIPVTKRENRYLRLRDKLDLGRRASHYLHLHADVSGGVSVQDDWPREPYLLVGFTHDRAKYERALRRLARYPHNLRTKTVRFSERHLDRLSDRIWDDSKKLRAIGFILEEGSSNTDTGKVEIGLITKRTDGAAYFERHYGPVKVTVVATEESSPVCTKSSSFKIAPDGMSLTVGWSSGGGAKAETIELTEYPDRVEVGAVERRYNGATTLEAFGLEKTVALSAPLGERPVIDAATGLRLRQVGPSPGEPACPERTEPTALDKAIEFREEHGLPHDPAYVERMLTRRVPFTKAEEQWLERRDRLVDNVKLEDYLDAHWKETAGWDIAGEFPHAPYVVVRVTANPARHRARLRKLVKGPLHVITVAHSSADLEALRDRILGDADAADRFFDGYGDAGFSLVGLSIDTDANAVVISVATPRTDALQYFQGRYGPDVRVEVPSTRFECPV